ncbi:uncharacterized protein CTRU02_211734 [Colletotrichum truncatum]|uniref:Uncharacterized protein n=1 Tax=Colletotrichum truncatum TaxID=5467 RepID=A0ACC3YLK8_COLTU|nr:uncharacterized protein CTRU02_14747 [Colletotrichum truncatum]KAF6781870.1 hypothetical protein CTRU02_14747 [Colletotrichum truncatum]
MFTFRPWILPWIALSTMASKIANDSLPLPSQLVAQVPGAWFENLAVRSNGNILITSCYQPNASVYELSNPRAESASLQLRFTIQTVNGLLGITETFPDVFAFVGSNISFTAGGERGAAALWTINFNEELSPSPRLIAHLPDAILLNGATSVPQNPQIVLVADSIRGLVWRVDITSGAVSIGAEVPEMGADQSKGPVTAINGLKIHDGYLWWSSLVEKALYRIKITDEGRAVCGASAEKMASLPASAADDLTFGPNGESIAWVATNRGNKIVAVNPDGEIVTVSESADIAAASALQFGRTKLDEKILYTTTAAGNIVAIDTSSLFEEAV